MSDDIQKWLDVVNQAESKQVLLESTEIPRGPLREFVDSSFEDDLEAWAQENPGVVDAIANLFGRQERLAREAAKQESLNQFIDLAQEVFDIEIDAGRSTIKEKGKRGAEIELAVKGKFSRQSISGFVSSIEEVFPVEVSGARINNNKIVIEIEIDMSGEQPTLHESLAAKLREFMEQDEAPQPQGNRYDYEATPEGGVKLYDLHTGQDGYLQPGDDANTFFAELEAREAEGKEFDDEFMEDNGWWSVIGHGSYEEPLSESQDDDEVRSAVGAMSPDEIRKLQVGDQVNYYTQMARTFIRRGHDVDAARRDGEVVKAADADDIIVIKADGLTRHEHVEHVILTRKEAVSERESTSSVEYRDEAGRFNVIYNYNRRQYKVHPMPDYEGLIETNWFDRLKDAIEHAERELDGAGEGVHEAKELRQLAGLE